MGLPIPQDIEIVARGYINKIEFVYQKNKTDEKLSIPTDSIILFNTFYSWQSEMQNYIARAVAGGLIAGAAGSIIGAMTTKEQQREVLFLKIQYHGEDNNISEIILSGRNNDDAYVKKFVNGCKELYSLNFDLVE
ncbi:hypothetical protein [Acetanaerobacterium elongatum]|uniref:hypothetical protein n=1 Tax=Acetanaerobacterium elongatum TaxID=258515 RepID=UPI000B85D3F1|nr:hypothetical protein [Acetanaerobacterium elongatum]